MEPAAHVLRLAIVLATVWSLASAAQTALTGLPQRGARSTFVIQAQEKESAATAAGPRALLIEDLLVDGQRRRLDSLERTGNWEVTSQPGIGRPLNLLLQQSLQPAGLTFQGKHFLIAATADQWSGEIRVERNGGQARTLAVEPASGEKRLILLEDPVASTSGVVFVVALLVFGAAAWGLAPIRGTRDSLPWLTFYLAGIHLLFWVGQCVGVMPDSLGYLGGIPALRDGVPSYFPPGYPAFLGLVGNFSGQNLGSWITLIQHGMAVLGGLWIYLLLGRLIPEELALLGGLLAGALSPILTLSQSVLSEIPSLFAMVGACYFAVRAGETGRTRFAILAGLLTGWAGTLRVVPLAALLPAICLVLLFPFSRRGLRLAGLTLAVTAGVVLLPISWFWLRYREPRLANSSGKHLFNRIVMEQQQLDERGPATRRLLALLEGVDPRGLSHWTVTAHRGLSQLSYVQGEALLRAVSMEGLRKDPWAYLRFTPHLAGRELLADASHVVPAWASTPLPNPRLERAPVLTFTAAGLRWRWRMAATHSVIWPLLCWAAIAGTLVGGWLPRRTLALALAWIPIGYLLSTASLEAFDQRYNVPIVPFVAALAMLPLGLLWPALAQHREGFARRVMRANPVPQA